MSLLSHDLHAFLHADEARLVPDLSTHVVCGGSTAKADLQSVTTTLWSQYLSGHSFYSKDRRRAETGVNALSTPSICIDNLTEINMSMALTLLIFTLYKLARFMSIRFT